MINDVEDGCDDVNVLSVFHYCMTYVRMLLYQQCVPLHLNYLLRHRHVHSYKYHPDLAVHA